MKKIELLAPAASYAGLKAVISAGADAVYIGGTKFGARAYADNLTKEDMISAIKYAHFHNVKIYMTVNILLKDDELLAELYDYILPYYEVGLDGVIVQDVGVLKYLDEKFPDLEKHASTQMTVVSSDCKELLKKYHVTRVVPARELSLEEIEEVKNNSGLEVEVFVHGALCYCYSGQCLLSSMIGDRSGNRGRCAQPCRKQYNVYVGQERVASNEYILSPKDMCGLYNLHNLIKIGVDSLKIEGRMKKIEYAACIVSIYRKYIDLYYKLGYEGYVSYADEHQDDLLADIVKMQDMYNRGGYTKGFFEKHNGADIMSTKIPSHYGTYVGKVVEVNPKFVQIKIEEEVYSQDLLQIRDIKQLDKSYEFTLKDGSKVGSVIKANYYKGMKLHKGQEVYRMKNNNLVNEITSKYIEQEKVVHISLNIEVLKDNPMRVSCVFDEDITYTYEYDVPEESLNRPITKENIKKQFNKVSGTGFIIDNMIIKLDDGLFVPLGKLNEIRRSALEKAKEDYVGRFYRNEKKDSSLNSVDVISVKKEYSGEIVHVKNINLEENESEKKGTISMLVVDSKRLAEVYELLNQLLNSSYDKIKSKLDRIYLELDSIENVGQEAFETYMNKFYGLDLDIYIALPRIIRSKHKEQLYKKYEELCSKDIVEGFLVRNIEGLSMSKHINNKVTKLKKVILDTGIYTMNSYAKDVWKQYGASGFTHSIELSKDEWQMLSKVNNIQVIDDINNEIAKKCLKKVECVGGIEQETVVYGKVPVMVTAGCIKKTLARCNTTQELLKINDNYDESYIVRSVCEYCYNVMYNSKPLDIIEDVRECVDKCNKKDVMSNDKNYIEIANEYNSRIRVDILDENMELLKDIIESACGDKKSKGQYKGHFYKKVL